MTKREEPDFDAEADVAIQRVIKDAALREILTAVSRRGGNVASLGNEIAAALITVLAEHYVGIGGGEFTAEDARIDAERMKARLIMTMDTMIAKPRGDGGDIN